MEPTYRAQSETAIVGSHVTIEGRDTMISGVAVYVEGDIMEIRAVNSSKAQLGEPVKLVVYSPDGLMITQSSVVARDVESVYVLTPVPVIQMYLQRRKQPRVEVKEMARIIALEQAATGSPVQLPFEIAIQNLSLGGMGIVSSASLDEQSKVTVEWDLEGPVECRLRIVHKRPASDGYYYGAEITDFPKQKLNLLRAYILRLQIEKRQKEKNAAASLDEASAI